MYLKSVLQIENLFKDFPVLSKYFSTTDIIKYRIDIHRCSARILGWYDFDHLIVGDDLRTYSRNRAAMMGSEKYFVEIDADEFLIEIIKLPAYDEKVKILAEWDKKVKKYKII
jgi:hypothetical protein